MVSEQKARIDQAFEAYFQRRQHEELPPDASDDACRFLRLQAAYDFDRAKARGWRPDELARGRLDGGAAITTNGEVFRQGPTISPELQQEAAAALSALGRAGTAIETVLMINLESASYGTWSGNEGPIRAAIAAAQSAVVAARQQADAHRQEQSDKIRVTVSRSFRGIGNVQYEPGTYMITVEERDNLILWRQRAEARARTADWDAPEGFAASEWPPFEIAD